MVPSSPNGPCSRAMATSTGPNACKAEAWRTASSEPADPRISTASWASSVSSGSRPSVTAKLAMASGSTTIQRPDRVMPIPTTS